MTCVINLHRTKVQVRRNLDADSATIKFRRSVLHCEIHRPTHCSDFGLEIRRDSLDVGGGTDKDIWLRRLPQGNPKHFGLHLGGSVAHQIRRMKIDRDTLHVAHFFDVCQTCQRKSQNESEGDSQQVYAPWM